MGSVLAANLVGAGLDVIAYDVAGPDRVPVGAAWVDGPAELARRADVVVLSLPDGDVSAGVLDELLGAGSGRLGLVVQTSTIGVRAARVEAARADGHGVAYVDAPVSGGIAGARSRTLTVMVAASDSSWVLAEPTIAGLSDRRHRVGDEPGMAQAMKLANNFLSATALAATSEALAFGRAVGLDPTTMIDVLNASSGRSAATEDKFPNEVLSARYASGFATALMAKDVGLYLDEVGDVDAPAVVGSVVVDVWRRFAAADPTADFTRIFPFVADGPAG
jgi:3-hydroxyisobutyrate dehydrogenase-like beta-hydroxyacid dehydrogenase